MPAKLWQRAWKRISWLQRLYGRILEPLTASHGAAKWMASLPDIPASPSALPERSSATKTQDTFGQMCFAWFEKSNPISVSLKTSPDIYDWGSNKSTMTFNQWVIALRRGCLQRRRLARHTDVNDSSSWPTVRVSSANTPCQSEILAGDPKGRLEVSAQIWPTATASDAHVTRARPPEKMIRKDGRNVLRTPSLAETILQPSNFPYTKQDLVKAANGQSYTASRIQWTTPNASDCRNRGSLHNPCIQRRMQLNKQIGLTMQASLPEITRQTLSRHPSPSNLMHGATSSQTLNPRFVEWLMGWPIGWTDFAPVETAWFHRQQRMRGELLKMQH